VRVALLQDEGAEGHRLLGGHGVCLGDDGDERDLCVCVCVYVCGL
jgi:hypothetical protein